MPFSFSGDQALIYPSYIDNATGRTLTAQPGGIYDMRAAGSMGYPVPPADGRWAVVTPAAPAAVHAPAAPVPAAPASTEEN